MYIAFRQLYRRPLAIARVRYSSNVSSPSTSSVQAKPEAIDPLKEYTPFGGLRKEKKSIWHYSDRRAGTGYSNYSSTLYEHRPYIWPPLRKYFKFNFYLVTAIFFLICWDYKWLGQKFDECVRTMKPEASQLAKEGDSNDNSSIETDEGSENASDEKPEKPKRKKIGFRERRIIQYEDRLRMYSTPDKIFRYFATLKVVDKNDESGRTFEVFMTPEDFLRSFTPGVMQPRKWGLDSFKVYQPDKYKHHFSDKSSIFYKLGENGLISFSDYLFLMTLLSTSPNDFALAFKIFDVNGDGALDKEEFQKVQQLIMSQTTVGQRHRDHITPNSSFKVESNSALEAYFFGKDGKKKLSADKFLEFQKSLYADILKMEFSRRDSLDGTDGLIGEDSFAALLLMHARIPEKREKMMIKRVKRKFGKHGQGVTFEETAAFFQFLYQIEDIAVAMHFHKMAGAPIDGPLLKRIGRKIAGVRLSEHMVDVIITLFDDNLDGHLSYEEMVAVLRQRMRRGLERPRDTGLFRLGDALATCARRAAKINGLSFSERVVVHSKEE